MQALLYKVHDYFRYLDRLNWREIAPYSALIFLFFLNSLLFFPGYMTPDSHTQYAQALSGVYDDHHPPLMAVVWRLLDILCKGPGLIFLMHMILLYSALYIFMMIMPDIRLKWLYVLVPIIPNIFFYSCMIWKDVGFAFSYLFVSGLIAYCCTRKKQISLLLLSILLIILFYGTSIKYQAQFIAPILLFGISYCTTNYKIAAKTFFNFFLISIVFFACLFAVNNYFVPLDKKSNSWQMVKLYDLAGISIIENKPLFPPKVMSANFSMQLLQERYNHKRVDDLFYSPGQPLILQYDTQSLDALYCYWKNICTTYFGAYLMHRGSVWLTMIFNKPLQTFDTMNVASVPKLAWLNEIKHGKKIIISILFYLRYLGTFALLIPFIVFYFFLGLYSLGNSEHAFPLLIMNGLSLLFLGVLFFCSMASDMRYLYIAACMTHSSHGLAGACYIFLKRKA